MLWEFLGLLAYKQTISLFMVKFNQLKLFCL